MNHDRPGISDSTTLLLLLKHSLQGLIDQALEAQQEEIEDFFLSQGQQDAFTSPYCQTETAIDRGGGALGFQC